MDKIEAKISRKTAYKIVSHLLRPEQRSHEAFI